MINTLEKHWGYSSFRENQEAAIADILEGKKDVLFLARTGAGKALHPSTPILTPSGYVPMEDLKEGDYVYGLDGKPTKVLSKHAPLTTEHYEIEFSNGQSIKCCSEHLWKLASGAVVDTSSLNVGDILPTISAPAYELSSGGFERGGWHARGVSSEIILSEDFLAGILFECGGGNVAMHHDKRIIDTIVELLSLLGIQATYYADLLHVVVWEGKRYPSKHYYTHDKPAKPLSVVSKRKIASTEQYYCITVDNEDSVFLASRANIPTHNSIVFQLPILMMEGMAIVISPLLALMQDQVLTAKEKGIKAYAYNSTLSKRDKRELLDKIKEGGVDLLYISPESLGSIIEYLKEYGKVRYIALDEAHCFPGDTRVITEEGAKSFYELESMSVLPKVLSKNLNTGRTEYRQIKKVFRNPFQPLLKISLNERSNFLVSYNHVIFTKRGEVLAKDLTVDDKIISFQQKPFNRQLTSNQKSFVIGSILGDGGCGVSVLKDKMRLKFVHSEKQKDYLIWKHKFLGNTTGIKSYINQGYSDFRMYSFSSSMFPVDEVIEPVPHGTKRTYFPDWVYEGFDEKSLAIWLMDDGTYSKQGYYTIHCNSFSEEVTRKFISLISDKFSILAEFREYDGYSCISFNKESSTRLKNLIKSYVHPSMAYKLGEEGNPNFVDWVDRSISLEEISIQGIQKVSTTYEHLYDIEVEHNHNYFIHCGLPILVHNCTSQYGHDFRPDYSLIGKELTNHFPTTPIVALTATADLETRQDIIDILRLGMNRDLSTYVQNLDRPNIHYHVEPREGNGHKQLLKILKRTDGRAIVYCLTKAECDAVSRFLYTHGYKARPYYSTISKRDKEVYLKGFINGDVQVICATSAFGLGIDVEVKTVVCLGMPGTIEDIAQFWGRGSRAGLEAHAYLLYNSTKDAGLHKYFLQNVSNPARRKVVEKKLRETLEFVQSDECLRKQILGYFGQEAPDDCGKCDNCC